MDNEITEFKNREIRPEVTRKAYIKIICDDRNAGRDLLFSLSEIGYQIISIVRSSADAMEAVHAMRPDLILLDAEMGEAMDIAENLMAGYGAHVLLFTRNLNRDGMEKFVRFKPLGWVEQNAPRAEWRARIEELLPDVIKTDSF